MAFSEVMFTLFRDIAPFVAILISFGSLFFVIKNYMFNVRNSFSKLSVVPVKDQLEFDVKKHEFSNNIYNLDFVLKTAFSHTLRFENIEGISGKQTNKFEKEGFPVNELRHDQLYWGIKVKNRGDLASTNILLEFTIVINKSRNTYNNENLIISTEQVEYARHKHAITIPYMGADEEKTYYFFDICGEFPSAQLYLDGLSTRHNKFISDQVSIDHYTHPSFDSSNRKFLGSKEFYK